MIYFQTKPDQVFSEILKEALDGGLAEVSLIAEEDDEETWEGLFPYSANCFAPGQAVSALKQLLVACRDEHAYRIPECHWLLLYECLRMFCLVHNDLIEGESNRQKPVGPFLVSDVDCDAIVQIYFWDTDFLLTSEFWQDAMAQGCGCSAEERQNRAVDAEFPVSVDALQIVKDVAWQVGEPNEYFGSGSMRYPDVQGEEEYEYDGG